MKNIKAHKLYIAKGIQKAKERLIVDLDYEYNLTFDESDTSEVRMLKHRIIIWTEHLNNIKDLKES